MRLLVLGKRLEHALLSDALLQQSFGSRILIERFDALELARSHRAVSAILYTDRLLQVPVAVQASAGDGPWLENDSLGEDVLHHGELLKVPA